MGATVHVRVSQRSSTSLFSSFFLSNSLPPCFGPALGFPLNSGVCLFPGDSSDGVDERLFYGTKVNFMDQGGRKKPIQFAVKKSLPTLLIN